jgi:putative PIN family toxin of toxin-antitoxin system
VRAVLDPNVLVSALVSSEGAPAKIVARWRDGDFELIASLALLTELAAALAYPRLRKRISVEDATAVIELLRKEASLRDDPLDPPRRSRDAGDGYLIALAEASDAMLVSGDRDLLALSDRLPIFPPREFIAVLD